MSRIAKDGGFRPLPPRPAADLRPADQVARALSGTHELGSEGFERLDAEGGVTDGVRRVGASTPPRQLKTREREHLGNAAANLFRGLPCRRLALGALSSSERDELARATKEVQAALPAIPGDRDGQRLLEAVTALVYAYRSPDTSIGAKAIDAVRGSAAESRDSVGGLLHLGDFQNQLVTLARRVCPLLLEDLVNALPELNLRLPALERTTGRLAAAHGRPLAGFNTVVIGHILGDAPAFFSALESVGLDKATTHVLAVPYSSNELAIEALRQRGYDTDNPQGADHYGWGETLDLTTGNELMAARAQRFSEGKEASVAAALAKAVQDHEQNGKPILVLDDGGYALKVAKEVMPERLALFRFVEQTTRGIRNVERVGCSGRPVISVAQSFVKKEIEGAFISNDLIQAMLRTIHGLTAARLAGARIAVIGYGTIGGSVARELARSGADVVVWDIEPAARAAARAEGINVVDELKDLLAGKQVVAGCTGNSSLDPMSFLYLDPNTALVSTSSMDVEFHGAGTNGQTLHEVQDRVAALLHAPPPTHPPPPGLHVSAVVDVPGSSLHGKTLGRAELWQNKISRAAMESLEQAFASFPGKVNIKMSCTQEMPRGLARALDIITGAATLSIDAVVPPDSGWRTRIADTAITGHSEPCSVYLANGGYPVNFDRAVQGIAPERIQITRAAMVAAAVQAALRDDATEEGGVIPLDGQFEQWIEQDFRDLAPAEYAFAVKMNPTGLAKSRGA
ncbi:MAG: NAD-binding protein [Deltaproteobacteria bacterium]|nr:NAD-binding protein [Deltaproteobacteria bacterium]